MHGSVATSGQYFDLVHTQVLTFCQIQPECPTLLSTTFGRPLFFRHVSNVSDASPPPFKSSSGRHEAKLALKLKKTI